MAKEGDLKKIELKVSVHCCDGCKKKVTKALRSTEGVFKTEMGTLEPKVTVFGNVEPQTLLKKLLKAGKQAEVWNYENQNARKECEETKLTTTGEKVNSMPGREQAKQPETQTRSTYKFTKTSAKKEGSNRASKEDADHETNTSAKSGLVKTDDFILQQPDANYIIHPSVAQNTSKIGTETNTQYYYVVEPRPVILPYCAVYPCKKPPPTPIYTCSQEVHNHAGIIYQTPVQAPASTMGDYFSDENTVGCQVM